MDENVPTTEPTMEVAPTQPPAPPAEPPGPRGRNADWLKKNWLVALVIANTLIAVAALVLALAYTGGGNTLPVPKLDRQVQPVLPGAPGEQVVPGVPGQDGQQKNGPAAAPGGQVVLRWLGVNLESEVAAVLGISAEDLQKELANGKTVAQVAQEKGIATDQLLSTLQGKLGEAFNQKLPDLITAYLERSTARKGAQDGTQQQQQQQQPVPPAAQ